MMQPQSRIKLNHRGLTELVLACAFLSLLTLAVWSWQMNGGHVTAMDSALPEAQSALMPQVLRHPVIILSAVVAEFILLLAIVLALVPPAWWLRADHLWGTDSAAAATPLRWLGAKMQQIGHSQTGAGEGQFAVNEAGEPIYYEQPGVPGMAANQLSGLPGQPAGVPVLAQPVPGQMQSGQSMPGQTQPGQPVPGQPVPGQTQQGQTLSGQPAAGTDAPPVQANTPQSAVPSPAPLTEVLNFDQQEEDDPLADLANIKDILSSAFDEDAGVDPDREALARSLDEVNVTTIRKTARQIVATFNQ
jgi:hypothetical protein